MRGKVVNLGTNLVILLILLVLVFLTVATILNFYSISELTRMVELDIQCMEEAANQITIIWNVIKMLHSEAKPEMVEYRIISRVVEPAEGSSA